MKGALNILMCPGQFHPTIGGAENQAKKLSFSLLRKGHRVEVLTPRWDRSWPRREQIGLLTIHRFSLIDLGRYMRGFRGYGPINTLLRVVQIRKLVGRLASRFDVLHAHTATPLSFFFMEAGHGAGKPVICKVAAGGDYSDFKSFRKSLRWGAMPMRRMVARMDRWVATSNQIRADLIETGADEKRIVKIPNGVELNPRKRPIGGYARHFLYLGRLTVNPFRDFSALLRAFDRLAQGIPQCELRLVGGGEREQEVRHLLKMLSHANGRTQMVGFSPPEPWLEWADVLIQPSFGEGMSNSLLEGMAAGLACIANDIPPNREVLDGGDAGILVPPGEDTALANAMKRLATTPGDAAMLGALAQRRAEEHYSIDGVADRYIELYADLLHPFDRR
jgi:glycosyltransferase involved in cell wall biosynthesis